MQPILNQQDKRWKDNYIGVSQLRLGSYGCTCTALAEANNKFGAECTPADVAAHVDWFTPEGKVLWNKLDMMFADFEWRAYTFEAKKVQEYLLSRDKAVLLEVKLPRGGKHWLFGEALGDNNSIYVRDPWTASIVNVFTKYGIVTGAAYMHKKI